MENNNGKHNIIAAERRRTIYRLLQENESVNAADLAETLNVGISTIRRDLDTLHDEGRLIRVHGGAVVKETATSRIPYRQSRGQHVEQKMMIAQAALSYLPESGTVFMGGGTTTYALATKLTSNYDFSIVTNALDIAAYVASNNITSVDFVGGTIRPESLQSNCEEALERLYWDVTFMGLAAIDIYRGITTDSRSAAHQEITILKHGGKFVALCDSSKIGRFAYAQVAQVKSIDVFITDTGANADFIDAIREEGVEVVIAGEE